jgi:hypothetical protein
MKLGKIMFAGAGMLVAAVAFARPDYGYTTTYYADATYGTVVGESEFTCSGRWFRSGVETDYFVISNENKC